MIKKRKFSFYATLTVLILSLICSVFGMFAVSANSGAGKEAELIINGSVKNQYSVNESVSIPMATIGDTVADFRVVLPDGTYTDEADLTLSKAGLYKVEYTAVVDGKVYREELSFIVGDSLFTVKGTGSSEFKEIGNSGIYGMYFNLFSGDTIEYNGLIDLNDFATSDSIIRLHPYVSKIGEADVTRFEITLTDAYDESKVVNIRYEQSIHGDENSYIDANFNGGKYCGLTTDFAHAPGNYVVDGLQNITVTYGEPFDDSRVNDETYYVQYQRGYVEQKDENGNVKKDANGNVVYKNYGTGTYFYYKFLEKYDSYTLSKDNTAFQRDLAGNTIVSKAALGEGYYGLKVRSTYENASGTIIADLQAKSFAAFVDSAKYGTAIMGGFKGTGTAAGKKVDQTSGKLWLGVSYDTATNVIYARSYSGQILPMADFRNGNIFGEAFEGFTDGKVKVSIKPTVLVKGTCGFFISEINGEKITESGSQNFISKYQPEITVDFGEYSESNVPNVKHGESYSVFPATAYDPLEGEVDVITSVYYGYGNVNKIQVNVSDGKFVANRVGEYTIVYTATNSSGKTTVKTVTVNSLNDDSELELNLVGGKNTDTVLAGTKVTALTDYSFDNAYGNTKLNVYAQLKSDKNVRFELNKKNSYSFTPIVSGEYEIVYEYSDYSSSDKTIVEFSVEESNKVYYTQERSFPEYAILNGNYDLDFVKSYTLDTGKEVEQKTLLYVINSAGEKVLIDGLLKVKEEYVGENGLIKIIYAPDKAGVLEEEYLVKEIPVIDTGLYTNKIDRSKYFVATSGSVSFEKNKDGMNCVINSFEDGKATFEFINVLHPNPFELKISALNKGENFKPFDSFNAYLVDVNDQDNYVYASLVRKENGWFISVNGAGELKISDVWGKEGDSLALNFNSEKSIMTINGFYGFKDVKFFGTDNLAKFPSGIKLVMEVCGKNGADGVMVESINGETMTNLSRDLSPARVDYAHDYNAGEAKLNEIISLKPFAVYDVLTPYVVGKLSVTYVPKGSNEEYPVKDVNGRELTDCDSMGYYDFKLTEYGMYTVTVSIEDELVANTRGSISYTINVTDYRKPVVVMDTSTRSAKVGDKLVLPAFSVEISDYDCYVTIKAPNKYFVGYLDINNNTKDTTDDEYIFATTGEYVVTLVVYDSNYNMSEIVYKVIVK